MNLNFLKPYLMASGQFLCNLDVGVTGTDDFLGKLLIYAVQAINAIEAGLPLPPLPDVLTKPVSEKLGKTARNSLLGVSLIIGIAASQTSGRIQLVLMYVNNVMTALLQEQPIPELDPNLGTGGIGDQVAPDQF